MIKELMYKWFGLTPPSCTTCDILRDQLEKSEVERRDLLHRLLAVGKPDLVAIPAVEEPPQPVGHSFTPWRVRQQMLEMEDHKAAKLMKDKKQEIEDLEKELGVNQPEQAVGER